MEEAFNGLVNELPKDEKGSYFVKNKKKVHMSTIMVFETDDEFAYLHPIEHRGKYMVCQCNANDDIAYKTLDELLRGLAYYGILMSDFLKK
jgi:hypothetical protein